MLCPSAPLKSEAPAGATSAPGKPLDAKSAAQAAPASQGKAAPAPVQSARRPRKRPPLPQRRRMYHDDETGILGMAGVAGAGCG